MDALGELARVTRDSVVLDLGCGDGRAALWLAKTRGCAVVGWDAAPECVDVARELRDADGSVPRHRAAFRVVDLASPDALREGSEAAGDARRATVVYAYLVREGLLRVRATLERVADLAACDGLALVTNTYHFREGEFPWPCVGEAGALRLWRRPPRARAR